MRTPTIQPASGLGALALLDIAAGDVLVQVIVKGVLPRPGRYEGRGLSSTALAFGAAITVTASRTDARAERGIGPGIHHGNGPNSRATGRVTLPVGRGTKQVRA
ncbi:hypothetical protein DKM19_23825 [Streptosporangium sp. 'caverna']|nr:hypothetical protein DKM19_23825 [Streptosporangium sp. 'caverna']